jgi:hypothetical protein
VTGVVSMWLLLKRKCEWAGNSEEQVTWISIVLPPFNMALQTLTSNLSYSGPTVSLGTSPPWGVPTPTGEFHAGSSRHAVQSDYSM